MSKHTFVEGGDGKCIHTFRTGIKCGFKASAKSQHLPSVEDWQPPESWGKVNLPDEEAKYAS